MTNKRKENRRTQKLTAFFTHGQRQDDADSSAPSAASSPQQAHRNGNPSKRNTPLQSQHSPLATSASESPEKARFRLDGKDPIHEVRVGPDSRDNTRELPDSIHLFPTNNQPVLDTTLKDMLVFLRSSLHADMMSCLHKFGMEIQSVSARVDNVETKMGEFATTTNRTESIDCQNPLISLTKCHGTLSCAYISFM